MMRTQTLIWIDGCIATVSMLFIMWQGRPWHSHLNIKQKMSLAIQVGIGLFIGMPSILTFFDLRKEPDHLGISYVTSFVLLLCFTLPFSLIATIGSFLRLSALDELKERFLDKGA